MTNLLGQDPGSQGSPIGPGLVKLSLTIKVTDAPRVSVMTGNRTRRAALKPCRVINLTAGAGLA